MALLVGMAGLAIGVFLLSTCGTIRPADMTVTNMFVMKRRALRFAVEHDALPVTPDQLPRMEGYHNSALDGWGRPILWAVDGDEVTLTSHGRDGRPGGEGEDADIIGVFNARTPDGRWADELGRLQIGPATPP